MAYKLIYFNGRGGAEPARMLMKYGGIEFEDVRVEHNDWPQLKEKTPWGQLPVLTHNGKDIGQTLAINRYLGRLVKLSGNNEWEDLQIDSMAYSINDLRQKFSDAWAEQDEARKKILKDKAIKEILPFYYTRFESIVEKEGYLALGRLTWVEFYFTCMANFCEVAVNISDTLTKYPSLTSLIEKVNSLPGVKEWVKTRPKTQW